MIDVEALFIPSKFLKTELNIIKEIDARILALMNQEVEEEPILTHEQIDSLLLECSVREEFVFT